MELVIQINGKLRSKITISHDASEDDIKASALSDDKVQAHLLDRKVKKFIVVPKKLVNIVDE